MGENGMSSWKKMKLERVHLRVPPRSLFGAGPQGPLAEHACAARTKINRIDLLTLVYVAPLAAVDLARGTEKGKLSGSTS